MICKPGAWKPGSGSQELGSQDLVARMWCPISGCENNENQFVFYRKTEILHKINEFRIGFVNIALENVAVAAARVVDRPSRSSETTLQKRRCLLNLVKLIICNDF